MNEKIREIVISLINRTAVPDFNFKDDTSQALTAINAEVERCLGGNKYVEENLYGNAKNTESVGYNQRAKDFRERWKGNLKNRKEVKQ